MFRRAKVKHAANFFNAAADRVHQAQVDYQAAYGRGDQEACAALSAEVARAADWAALRAMTVYRRAATGEAELEAQGKVKVYAPGSWDSSDVQRTVMELLELRNNAAEASAMHYRRNGGTREQTVLRAFGIIDAYRCQFEVPQGFPTDRRLSTEERLAVFIIAVGPEPATEAPAGPSPPPGES